MVLGDIKRALRVTSGTYDSEIQSLIIAANADLNRIGVRITPSNAALVNHAVIMYCKTHFGYNEDSEKYAKIYYHMAAALALSREDNEE